MSGSPIGLRALHPSQTRRDLKNSMIDGVCWSLMVGLGESYLPAFVLALSLGETASGLIVTLPPAIGAVLQLASARLVAKLGSHRRWVVLTAALQVLSLLPLAVCGLVGQASVWIVFLAATTYYTCGLAGGSAWSTWVGTLVPRRVRSRFFGSRQRALQVGTMCGFLLGGIGLHLVTSGVPLAELENRRSLLLAFAVLLTLAALARAGSVFHLWRQSEPVPLPEGHRVVGPRELWTRLAGGAGEHRGLRLLMFIFSMQLAAKVSEPFLTSYLLEDLRTESLVFATLIGAQMFGKALALSFLGPLAARVGPRRVMLIAGIAVVPLGGLFLMGTSLWWVLAVQVASGVAWACYDLATFLLILEDVPEHERTSLMGVYFLGVWVCSMVGTLLGAGVLHLFAGEGGAVTHTGYMLIFAVSSVLRLLVSAFALPAVVRAPGAG